MTSVWGIWIYDLTIFNPQKLLLGDKLSQAWAILECDIMWHVFSPLDQRTGWLHHHGGGTVIYRVICAAASVAHHFCAFPVAESVDFVDLSPNFHHIDQTAFSMEKRYEKIVLNATERVSGANDRNVSWNEMDGGEHHSQAWTSHHGWLHRAISLSRGHLIFQAHSTWWARRQWKLHLDGHLIHLMSLGRRTLIYFDHLWSLESVTRHTYSKSYKYI